MNIYRYKIVPYGKIFVHYPTSKYNLYLLKCDTNRSWSLHISTVEFLETLCSLKQNSAEKTSCEHRSLRCAQPPASSPSPSLCQCPSNSTLTTVIGWWSRRYRFVFLMTPWLFFPLVILIEFQIRASVSMSRVGQPSRQGPIGNLIANILIQT